MLVKYDAKPHQPRSSKRPSTTPSIEMNFDPYRLITKVNNHKKPSTPDFRLMSSRPEGRILPSYMQVKLFITMLKSINLFFIF
jgi:hypothetical protein